LTRCPAARPDPPSSEPIASTITRSSKNLRDIYTMETPTPPATSSPEKQCQQCGRPLKGRTDKRFCNDDCRNNFNRAKRRKITDQAPDTIPEIIRIIKRNYQILLTNFNF